MMIEINEPVMRSKMASFDYDWTLVKPKDDRPFPKDVDDWEFLFSNIIEILTKYHEDGYMIVIFTNQTKKWKIEQIKNVMSSINIPMYAVFEFDKDKHKPEPYLFTEFVKDFQIDKKESFFVGDALGRQGDWSDSDKVFAENIGIKYISPEEMFYVQEEFIIPEIPLSDDFEMIIMMGYPGSGKSTIAAHILDINDNYAIVSGDIHKSLPKMKKDSLKYIGLKSIVFDATHSSFKKRLEYIKFAKKHNYSVKCIHVTTSFDISYKRNKCRVDKKQVPRIAYNVYKKYYEEPCADEGFILISV
jgi:bifunctional polynucleotide phosphatase/kinase